MAEGPAAEMCERARAWAEEEPRVAAALVYGSVARGRAHELSDLDLVVVAQSEQREALWQERQSLAARLLGAPIIFSQEPGWQRPYRFQAWRADLVEVDLTYDERNALAWEGIAAGFVALVDRAGVAEQLRRDLASWQRPAFDAAFFDQGTWPWLLWLAGRLRHGRYWMVRYGVMDTLNNRVVPLLDSVGPMAEESLAADDMQRLYLAAPRSVAPEELARSLCATAELYDLALDRWAARTGQPRPVHPLAAPVLKLLKSHR